MENSHVITYTILKCSTSTFYQFPEHSTEKMFKFSNRYVYEKFFLIFRSIMFEHEKLTYCCYFINKTRTKVGRNLKALAYKLDKIGSIIITIYGHLLMWFVCYRKVKLMM